MSCRNCNGSDGDVDRRISGINETTREPSAGVQKSDRNSRFCWSESGLRLRPARIFWKRGSVRGQFQLDETNSATPAVSASRCNAL
jgi:hypothetical protein